MKPEDLKDKVIEITGAKFKIISAYELQDEWSLVGYWMDGEKEPEIPVIQHLMIGMDLIAVGLD